jgi:hypothetical protein
VREFRYIGLWPACIAAGLPFVRGEFRAVHDSVAAQLEISGEFEELGADPAQPLAELSEEPADDVTPDPPLEDIEHDEALDPEPLLDPQD